MIKIFLFVMVCFLTVVMGVATSAEAETEGKLPKVLRVGFSARILSDIDPRDAQAAMEIWTRELSRSMGLKNVPQTVIFNSNAELIEALKREKLFIVSLPAVDYLKIRKEIRLLPSFVSSVNGGRGREFMLLRGRIAVSGRWLICGTG